MKIGEIEFPSFTGKRCLMMPYIQGDLDSVPVEYKTGYEEIIESVYFKKGDIGYLTIDESIAKQNKPHRGFRAQYGRALHTEAGRRPNGLGWGHGWGKSHEVTLDRAVQVILANNLDDTCAIWETEHEETSLDGDIGYLAKQYPYSDAVLMKAGEVQRIGILTPHESLPVKKETKRQFLRIVSSGVHGREQYFTENPLMDNPKEQ